MMTTDCLNDEQRAAALDTEGAVLVTAGAGSGKTRLLTHRIAHIIQDLGVPAYNVLAITFTNKAADEMRNRLYALVPSAGDIWVSTFHSMCARILRRHASVLGYGANFTIYSQDESERLVRQIIKDMELESDNLLKSSLRGISEAKNEGLTSDEYEEKNGDYVDIKLVVRVFREYEKRLKANNAMDFDDLLTKTYELFSRSEEILGYYRNKFRYIHVDEFQDTNEVQYGLVRLLAGGSGNVFVVGDEDQSIYGWRGANVTNIQKFIEDFGAKIYKLERNYRSTKKILDLANNLIKNNTSRIEKKLWSSLGDGEPPVVYKAMSEGGEADFVANTISKLLSDGYRPHDFAVLMRINALTRTLEQRFMQRNIPYKVYGGFKFFDRKEVKDVIAYLRVLSNPSDDEAVMRIINFPKRGIGDTTVTKLNEYASETGKRLYEVIESGDYPGLSSSAAAKVRSFADLMAELKEYKRNSDVAELTEKVIELADIRSAYHEDNEENTARKLNIDDFVSSAHEFVNNRGGTLEDFLQEVTLYTEGDAETSDSVFLSTVHSAKGMEFRCVFVIGAEEGLFPLTRANDDIGEMEEERRLMYVAITRAKEKLFVTYCASRFMYGENRYCRPSRFLGEMDARLTSLYGARREEKAAEQEVKSGYGYRKFSVPKESGVAVQNKAVRQAQVSVNDFPPGTRVRHKKFGEGVVRDVTNVGTNSYLVIDFGNFGKITLSLAFAPIEKI